MKFTENPVVIKIFRKCRSLERNWVEFNFPVTFCGFASSTGGSSFVVAVLTGAEAWGGAEKSPDSRSKAVWSSIDFCWVEEEKERESRE